jgi:polyisoprenoid-binding protein YceI
MRAWIFAAALAVAGAAHAEPVSYTLDPAHTQVAFVVDRFGFNRVLGRFEDVTGELVLDEENPANSSVRATIQIASVDSSNDTRDEHLRGERWLNAAQFPTMEFRSTGVRLTGDTTAEVTGDLTMLGQTHPVTLDVTLNNIGGPPNAPTRRMAGFSATGSLTRSVWGPTTAAAPGMIGDMVSITIEALAVPVEAEN